MMKGNRNIWRAAVAFAIIGIVSLAFAGCPTKVENTDGEKELAGTVSISPAGPVSVGAELTANYSGSDVTDLGFKWKMGDKQVGTGKTHTATEAGSYTVTASSAGYRDKSSTAVTVNVKGDSGGTSHAITVNEGGTGFSASPNPAKQGDKVTLNPGTKTGYSFASWTVVSPSDLTISDNGFTMPPANVEVTATWTAIPYTISINEGGSSFSASPNPATIGQTVTLNPGTKTGANSSFAGWKVDSPAGLKITGNTFTMPGEAVSVTAI